MSHLSVFSLSYVTAVGVHLALQSVFSQENDSDLNDVLSGSSNDEPLLLQPEEKGCDGRLEETHW